MILSLEWLDLGGTLERAAAGGRIDGTIASVSLDQLLHNGWGKEHFSPVPADVRILATADSFVTRLLADVRESAVPPSRVASTPRRIETPLVGDRSGPMALKDIAIALDLAAAEQPVTLIRVPNGWPSELWHFNAPLDFLGADGEKDSARESALLIGASGSRTPGVRQASGCDPRGWRLPHGRQRPRGPPRATESRC